MAIKKTTIMIALILLFVPYIFAISYSDCSIYGNCHKEIVSTSTSSSVNGSFWTTDSSQSNLVGDKSMNGTLTINDNLNNHFSMGVSIFGTALTSTNSNGLSLLSTNGLLYILGNYKNIPLFGYDSSIFLINASDSNIGSSIGLTPKGDLNFTTTNGIVYFPNINTKCVNFTDGTTQCSASSGGGFTNGSSIIVNNLNFTGDLYAGDNTIILNGTTNSLIVNNTNFTGNLYSNDNQFKFNGTSHNLNISQNITALFFVGAGSRLTGISIFNTTYNNLVSMSYTNVALINKSNTFIGTQSFLIVNFTSNSLSSCGSAGSDGQLGRNATNRIYFCDGTTWNYFFTDKLLNNNTIVRNNTVNLFSQTQTFTNVTISQILNISGDFYSHDKAFYFNTTSNDTIVQTLNATGTITTSNGSAWNTYVVCYLAGGTLGHCISIVGVGGTCTCSAN